MTQQCNTCGVTKALDEFSLRKDSGKYRPICKSCRSSYTAVKRYNVSLGFIEELRQKQECKCAICGIHEDDIEHKAFKHNPLVIDHNHQTGEVRGLLCSTCNTLLGHAKDDPQVLIKAVAYLLK